MWQNAVLLVVIILQDDGTAGNEQSRTNQTEENIDSLIDWGAQNVAYMGKKDKNFGIVSLIKYLDKQTKNWRGKKTKCDMSLLAGLGRIAPNKWRCSHASLLF